MHSRVLDEYWDLHAVMIRYGGDPHFQLGFESPRGGPEHETHYTPVDGLIFLEVT
jgi:hypothetical protein